MTPQEIAAQLQERFGAKIIATFADDKHPRIHINAGDWREIALYLHDDPSLKLDWMQCHSGVDYVADGKMCCVNDLWSFTHHHEFAVKVFTPREKPSIPSVADIWRVADWHEREAYDLLGIDFPGHPDLRRILCADDWEGFPLRKDYVFPREYHGIPGSVELDWQQKPDYPK
jgi:NADH-quinone oxidoreductase subunit C